MRTSAGRFIPAGAGNTAGTPSVRKISAVYPRWRGEHVQGVLLTGSQTGLSPLARGTLQIHTECERYERFIPAGAGNTRQISRRTGKNSVYPRWRGEHPSRCAVIPAESGLSPLARGTPIPVPSAISLRRFIPAGAGNTTLTIRPQISRPVYPRWRWEHETTAATLILHASLSPLARGTLDNFLRPIVNPRFIPAGAGNTSTKSGMVIP